MTDDRINPSHPASFLCQYLNHKLLVFFSPFFNITIRANDEFDVFCDVLDLAVLSMQRNRAECQRAQDKLDVGLGSARHTNPHIRNLQSDELLHETQDFLTVGRQSGRYWAFIKGIDHNIYCGLSWEREQILQTLGQFTIARMLRAMLVCRIEFGEGVVIGVRLFTKLDQERGKEPT